MVLCTVSQIQDYFTFEWCCNEFTNYKWLCVNRPRITDCGKRPMVDAIFCRCIPIGGCCIGINHKIMLRLTMRVTKGRGMLFKLLLLFGFLEMFDKVSCSAVKFFQSTPSSKSISEVKSVVWLDTSSISSNESSCFSRKLPQLDSDEHSDDSWFMLLILFVSNKLRFSCKKKKCI